MSQDPGAVRQIACRRKPSLNHSLASKPAMVRRAVMNDWKSPTFGMFFFTRKWSVSMPCWRRRRLKRSGSAGAAI